MPNIEPRIVSAFKLFRKPFVDPDLEPETHYYWTLDYFFDPGTTLRLRSLRSPWQKRKPFVAHLYPPNAPHWQDSRRNVKPPLLAYISICAGERLDLARFVPRGKAHATFIDPSHILGELLLEIIAMGARRGNDGFPAALSLMYAIVDVLTGAHRIRPGVYMIHPLTTKGAPPLVAAVMAYLEEHLAQRVTLRDLALQVGTSASSLSHQYKAQTGEAPLKSLARLRIGRARRLLMEGHSVKSAAEATGFCDAFHLSRKFKQIEGISPRDYVRMLRAEGRAKEETG